MQNQEFNNHITYSYVKNSDDKTRSELLTRDLVGIEITAPDFSMLSEKLSNSLVLSNINAFPYIYRFTEQGNLTLVTHVILQWQKHLLEDANNN